DDWSRKAPEKYHEPDQTKTWESFDRPYDGQPITVATIFHLAKEFGWRDFIRDPTPTSAAQSATIDLSGRTFRWDEQTITAAELNEMTFSPIRYVGGVRPRRTKPSCRPSKSWEILVSPRLVFGMCRGLANTWCDKTRIRRRTLSST